VHRNNRSRLTATLATTTLAVAGSLLGLAGPAFAGTGFTPGDLVVEQVGTVGGATPSSTSAPVSLWDYSTSGTPSGYVDTFSSTTSTDTASSHALVDSGTATYNGEISLSADGQYIYVAGYDANAGVASITSSSLVPRTVGIASADGTLDTSTALASNSSDSSPPNLTATGINFRTATGTTGGTPPFSFYSGGDDGLAISPDGVTTGTSLNADTIHQLNIDGGQLYESTTSAMEQVGTGTPTSGSPTDKSLIASPPSKFEPAGFAFVTVGSATSPNVLYVADTKNSAVEKYIYNGTTWVEKGAVTVSNVTGLAASVSGSTVNLYVTNQGDLYGITDSSGAAGTLSSTAAILAAAPTGESMKGVVLAPVNLTTGNGLPETPFILFLPLLAIAGLAGYVAVRRRHIAA